MLEKYMQNGKVDCAAIAMDVKMCKLSPDDIRELCKHKEVQDSYIGEKYENKKPKQYWNKEHLDYLYWVSVAESFNLDYLLYLSEVADFVSKATYKKIVIAGVTVVLVIVAGMVLFRIIIV